MGLLVPDSVWERYRDRNILLMSAILENSGHKSGSNCSDHYDRFVALVNITRTNKSSKSGK